MKKLFFLLLILPLVLFSQENPPLEYQLINQESTAVEKNSRLELGFILPDSIMKSIHLYLDGKPHKRRGLNPFVSWDVDIKVTFEHISTARASSAIGFWYTEVDRNLKTNKWDYQSTELPFRIRFSPSLLGEWKVKINVFIHGQLAYELKEKMFKVLPSNYKGLVSINDTTQYLQRDHETIIPTGVNLPYPTHKNNLVYSQDPEEKLNLEAWLSYRNLIQDYVLQGGEYFRFFMTPSCTGIEFEEVGYYQDRQHLAWEIDQLLSYCEKTNTLIDFNMMLHTRFMKLGDYGQYRFDFTDNWHSKEVWPYKDINSPSGYSKFLDSKTPSDMFLSDLAMKYLKERTRYIMARWGYSNSVLAFELLSEPWHIDQNGFTGDSPYDELSPAGDTARKAVYQYHKKIAEYIKDSLQYTDHLLGAVGRLPVGSKSVYSHYTPQLPSYIDSTWYVDQIDIISISFYSKSPEKFLISKSSRNNTFGKSENSVAHSIHRLKEEYQKPILVGESDHGDGTGICSDYQGHYIDVMRYPFTGAIGHFIWAAFIHTADNQSKNVEGWRDERKTWKKIIDAKDYFNSTWFQHLLSTTDVLGREKRSFAHAEKEIVEQQYMIAEDRTKAAGYVYNRTFNVNTAKGIHDQINSENPCSLAPLSLQEPITITWRPKRLKLEGLQSWTKYNIYFYGYQNNDFLFRTQLRTSISGKLKITHPPLIPKKEKNPLIWYRIEKIK